MTFHVDAPPGERLPVWDRLEHDLVERVVTNDLTPCVSLGLTLLVGPVDGYPVALRLARDADGTDLLLTEKEGRLAEARAREAESAAREKAETRVAELERQLTMQDRPTRS